MILPPEDAALFYRAWWPLLAWVNDQRHIVPSFPTPTPDRPIPVPIANPVRLALWADDSLREQFLVERGSALASAERELIASWKHRVGGHFVVFKHLRSHSIFMNNNVFGVVGIYSPLPELVRTVPAYVDAFLLPFGDRIIIDGILTSPGVQLSFGAGMRRIFERQYAEARDRSQIRTSLGPTPRRPVTSPAPTKPKHPARARASTIVGAWRITDSELWDRDALDLVEDAFVRFGPQQLGELAMIALRADVDYRLGWATADRASTSASKAKMMEIHVPAAGRQPSAMTACFAVACTFIVATTARSKPSASIGRRLVAGVSAPPAREAAGRFRCARRQRGKTVAKLPWPPE